ncbi:formate hydrogenlyase subunit 3/multisubunit Na+/H+ antiporter MnhD subunit [Natronospira proteinivora]|uniref:Formate hydrogenlyase subunit 3/multisubunit Na+/H+ antiporter MnhD subunit n=1 Tax=Natronospira proteinivora TaxID=1807133 RepID=A0ABT1G6M6_9GAMM|nr:complex I subunit 5 family protein [Natronospira proteinivora]MCP1726747.1 formate hydrogenlyase subunit 3/multisubunit Na+/H+ antiporter MnhD subunit [Natronospira proteinivora]
MSLPSLSTLMAFCLPCLPLLLAMGLYIPRLRQTALTLAPWAPLTALPLLGLQGMVVDLPWLLLGARVGIDGLSAPLLILAITAWTLAGWHACRHMEAEGRQRFFLFWLLSWTGNLCVFITLDTASFYAAYAMMTFSAYGLVVFYRRPEDYRAGRIYLMMALLGEGLIISGLLLLGNELGNAALGMAQPGVEGLEEASLAVWLFMAGFAVKMGLVPLHIWLPLAHPRAPVAASAVLSGVILVAGLMGWLRFLPIGETGFQLPGQTLLGLGLATAFIAVILGLCQEKAKPLLAYSSISQMGLISAGVGAALAFPEQAGPLLAIVVLFALHHGLAKAALFMSVDVLDQPRSWIHALRWLPALALAGAPLTSGALAKVSLKGHWPEALSTLETGLLLSSVATTLLMLRYGLITASNNPNREQTRLPWPWLLLLLAGLSLPWLTATQIAEVQLALPFQHPYLLDTVTPIAAGLIIAAMARRWWPTGVHPRVPPGDLIVLFRWKPSIPVLIPPVWPRKPRTGNWSAYLETRLTDLGTALLLWLGLLVLIFLLR